MDFATSFLFSQTKIYLKTILKIEILENCFSVLKVELSEKQTTWIL